MTHKLKERQYECDQQQRTKTTFPAGIEIAGDPQKRLAEREEKLKQAAEERKSYWSSKGNERQSKIPLISKPFCITS